MRLKYITISGTNEYTNIEDLAMLLFKYPTAEAGIQVSGTKCSYGSPRFEWIIALNRFLNKNKMRANIALHINMDWVEKICMGIVVPELKELLDLKDYKGEKFIKRVQLNFKIGREHTPSLGILHTTLYTLIKKFSDQRFILSYNDSNAPLINKLYESGLTFDNLFDSSFGKGIEPSTRPKPCFCGLLQGYAGGLGADNIADELRKLKAIDGDIYVDAQKKLEDENEHLDLNKAKAFILNALRATRK